VAEAQQDVSVRDASVGARREGIELAAMRGTIGKVCDTARGCDRLVRLGELGAPTRARGGG